jgi:HEAT repeat protein
MPLPGSRWRIRSLMVLVALCALAAGYARYRHDMAPVEQCKRRLASFESSEREQAIIELRRYGPAAREVEPQLLAIALRDRRPSTRHEAAFLLVRLGNKSPALARALATDAIAVARGQEGFYLPRGADPLDALVELDSPAEVVVPLFAEMLKVPELRPRALSYLGTVLQREKVVPVPAIDLLVGALGDDDRRISAEAARILSTLGLVARQRGMDTLLKMVETAPPTRALTAAMELLLFETDRSAAVPMLCKRLRGEDVEGRFAAFLGLGMLGEDASPAVPEIVRAMVAREAGQVRSHWSHGGPQPSRRSLQRALRIGGGKEPLTLAVFAGVFSERSAGALALELIGEEAEERGVGLLLEILEHGDAPIRVGAIASIGAIRRNGVSTEVALPTLLGRLAAEVESGRPKSAGDDQQPEAVVLAAALARIGPDDARVIRAIASLVGVPDKVARDSAARILGELGPKAGAAVPDLVRLLKAPDAEDRSDAAKALGRIRADGDRAVPALNAALGDEDWRVRVEAAWSLGNFGPDEARAGVSAMIDLLHDPDDDRRGYAARTFRHNSSVAEPAIPALLEAMGDNPGSFLEYDCKDALRSIAPGDSRGGRWFISLRDGTSPVRRQAACAIGRLHEGDAKSIAALVEALDDRDIPLRAIAAAALGCLGPAAEGAAGALEKALKSDQSARSPRRPSDASGRRPRGRRGPWRRP